MPRDDRRSFSYLQSMWVNIHQKFSDRGANPLGKKRKDGRRRLLPFVLDTRGQDGKEVPHAPQWLSSARGQLPKCTSCEKSCPGAKVNVEDVFLDLPCTAAGKNFIATDLSPMSEVSPTQCCRHVALLP